MEFIRGQDNYISVMPTYGNYMRKCNELQKHIPCKITTKRIEGVILPVMMKY